MWLLILPCVLAACAGVRQGHPGTAAQPSALPPAGLASQQVPLFVCFGSDDNGYSGLEGSGAAGGLHFLTQLVAARFNPAGMGNPGTFFHQQEPNRASEDPGIAR